jgi:hypothetical protein
MLIGNHIKAIWVLDATADGVANFFEQLGFYKNGQVEQGVTELFRYHNSHRRDAAALKSTLESEVRAQASVSSLARLYQDVLLLKPYQQATLAADLVLAKGSESQLQTILKITLLSSEAEQYKQLYMSQELCKYIIQTLGLELTGEQTHEGFHVGDTKMLLVRQSAENAIVIILVGEDLEFRITVG